MRRTQSNYDSADPALVDDQCDTESWTSKQSERSGTPEPPAQHPETHYYTNYYADGECAALIDYREQAVKEFVGLYYRTLATAPQDVWRHYTVKARYAHADGDPHSAATAEAPGALPAVGQRQIHAAIVHWQQWADCRFCVAAVHAQRTPAGDYVALVTGTVCRSRRPPAPFVQTFVLCRVAATDQWAISNAMLHTDFR